MSDLLSAASLLLAIITVIYGLWYDAIVKALEIVPKDYKEDNAKHYQRVRLVRRSKAAPLMWISSLLTLVFLPDVLRISWLSGINYLRKGAAALCDYSAVTTSFVIVTCLLGVLAVHFIHLNWQLHQLLKRLDS